MEKCERSFHGGLFRSTATSFNRPITRWPGFDCFDTVTCRGSDREHIQGGVQGFYGYLWWTSAAGKQFDNVTLPEGSFSARGHGGHVILVVPALDLVVVHRVDTDKKNRQRVECAQFGAMMKIILSAMPATGEPAAINGEKN